MQPASSATPVTVLVPPTAPSAEDVGVVNPLKRKAEDDPAASAEADGSAKRRKVEKVSEDSPEFAPLLAIINDTTLSPAQKNMKFLSQLKSMQLTCFNRLKLISEFTAHDLTLAVGSANDGLPADNLAVENASLPFYVLDRNAVADLTLGYAGPQIDFTKIVLPKALRSEINGDAKVKEKAGVSEVTTVQQWAHGTLYGFNIKLPEPMPNLTIDSYSAVTFAPVKEEVDADGKTKKIGYWDPFFKGQSGAKVVLTYINDDESSQAQGGASGIVTHNAKYTVVQDSTKKKHHWSVEPIDAEDYDSAVTRIKRRASNVVIMPIKPIPSATPVERQNSGTILRGDDTLKGQAPKGAAVAPAYGKASVNGPHRVDTEGTVHVQMRVIPIDVSGIKSEDELSNYMKRLGKMVIELAEIGAKQLVEPQQSTALKEKVDPTPAAPAAATAKKVEMKKPELIKHAEWLANYARDKISTAATDFFGNLFSAPKN